MFENNFFIKWKKIFTLREPSMDVSKEKPYLLWKGLEETLELTLLSCLIAFVVGLLLGLILYLNRTCKKTYFILNMFVNIMVSTPYIILSILLINQFLFPIFKISYGFPAGLFCLSMILIFVFARNCEQVFLQVNPEMYQTAYSLGADRFTFCISFLLREACPYLILKLNILFVSALAYSNALYFLGCGGIGSIAFYKGFQGEGFYHDKSIDRNDLIWACLLIIFVLTQITNLITNYIAFKLNKG